MEHLPYDHKDCPSHGNSCKLNNEKGNPVVSFKADQLKLAQQVDPW